MQREEVSQSFFFQAEDGIRDTSVTGVQTCALPICPSRGSRGAAAQRLRDARPRLGPAVSPADVAVQIGRASCRERVVMLGVAASLKKTKRRRLWSRKRA